ncbi:MAG: hypothetical protein HYX87_07390 [Chloroflexi bacterium]|nr:hypothetical protein [Chloroflexota bacterium]
MGETVGLGVAVGVEGATVGGLVVVAGLAAGAVVPAGVVGAGVAVLAGVVAAVMAGLVVIRVVVVVVVVVGEGVVPAAQAMPRDRPSTNNTAMINAFMLSSSIEVQCTYAGCEDTASTKS